MDAWCGPHGTTWQSCTAKTESCCRVVKWSGKCNWNPGYHLSSACQTLGKSFCFCFLCFFSQFENKKLSKMKSKDDLAEGKKNLQRKSNNKFTLLLPKWIKFFDIRKRQKHLLYF